MQQLRVKTLEFRDGSLWLLDQTKLPLEPSIIECRTPDDVAEAILNLRVRGAPAIGCGASYGVVLAAAALLDRQSSSEEFESGIQVAVEQLRRTRPTAVNLRWALERMQRVLEKNVDRSPAEYMEALREEADRMLAEDEESNRRMGLYGADLIPDGANVLTHCNAGSLATAAFGTALGVLRTAHDQGKSVHVWVDETRPLLQGARLTAWELQQEGIPFTLITDNMAAHFMSRGRVDLVMVGADRVSANGDTANKIGTYGLAVLAHAHRIPFYFAAPTSTIDLTTPSGDAIPIEERKPEEVTSFGGVRVAPEGISAANPAFDVTPARLVTALITDAGIVREPFPDGLRLAVEKAMDSHPKPVERALAAPEAV